jgi:hypothetical protein
MKVCAVIGKIAGGTRLSTVYEKAQCVQRYLGSVVVNYFPHICRGKELIGGPSIFIESKRYSSNPSRTTFFNLRFFGTLASKFTPEQFACLSFFDLLFRLCILADLTLRFGIRWG